MSDKILVIISSGDKGVALTGMMYAKNAVKFKWMSDVKVILFGPAEAAVLQDEDLEVSLRDLMEQIQPVACKAISDNDRTSERLEALGVSVKYVGPIISGLIKEGYVPLVF